MEKKRFKRYEVNIVSWMSGLNRHPAKVLYIEICTVGSNPTLTANIIDIANKVSIINYNKGTLWQG